MSLNNAYSPSTESMIYNARKLFKSDGEDKVLKYLSECASHDYKCPDVCDNWALEFYNENESEIEG